MSADRKSKSLLHFRSNWICVSYNPDISIFLGKQNPPRIDPQGPPAVHNRRDEITLGRRKKSRKSGNSDMLPSLALCAVRWIHSSIASKLHLLSEISHRVFRRVPRRREKHDFLVDPRRIRQRATNRKRKTRLGSMLASDRSTKRDAACRN